MSVAAKITAAAAEKVVGSLISELLITAKGAVHRRLKTWMNQTKLRSLSTHIRDLRLVKTVWQFERATDLLDFYYPSKLIAGGTSVEVRDISDIPVSGNIIIQGTIGQGKSIFLRYLAVRALGSRLTIPLLVELRRLRGQSLVPHIVSEMKALGLSADEDLVEFLLETGRVSLLLDGFDEVPEEGRSSLINELELIARRHPRTRTMITSRPDSAIQRSPLFSVVHLAPLTVVEQEALIHKLMSDGDDGKYVVKAVRATADLRTLLTTPLMVTLLVFRYRATQTIPENTASFYANLFDLLLHRHDKTKPGFARPRKSGLGDADLESAFNALCFLMRKVAAVSVRRADLLAFAREALRHISATTSPEALIADLQEITCLLIEEAGECRMVHKSVQEYHAACFVSKQSDVAAQRFYEAMSAKWHHWSQELLFLATVDRYRFLEHFGLNDLQSACQGLRGRDGSIDRPRALALAFGDDELVLERKGPGAPQAISLTPSSRRFWCVAQRASMLTYLSEVTPLVTSVAKVVADKTVPVREDGDRMFIRMRDIAGHTSGQSLARWAFDVARDLITALDEGKAALASHRATSQLLSLE